MRLSTNKYEYRCKDTLKGVFEIDMTRYGSAIKKLRLRIVRAMVINSEYVKDLFAKDLDIKRFKQSFEYELPVGLSITHKSEIVKVIYMCIVLVTFENDKQAEIRHEFAIKIEVEKIKLN